MAPPAKKRVIAALMLFTFPIWVVPALLFITLHGLYKFIYEEILGWDDF